jgi:branched-chain amino acid transport system ATP-binding protein
MLLNVEGISKSFGGVAAVDDVSFSLMKRELRSIIGPNGAGKTTLFNLLTGHIPADAGRIYFKEKNIAGMPPHSIARSGIGRSFQRISIFSRLSVFENVHVGILSRQKKSYRMFWPARRTAREETLEILEAIGLEPQAGNLAATLPHGDQKRLEVGIALALGPELLLLDEPTAGMSPEERLSTIDLIGNLVKERGLTLLFTEHDMDIVFSVSEKITVLNQGQVIAEGTPEEIRSNAEVQKVYLGEAEWEATLI